MDQRRDRLLVAAAIAATVFALSYFPDGEDGSGAVLAGLAAFFGVAIALGPATAYRALPKRSTTERMRLLPRSLGLGIGLGLANLMINYGMAMSKPAIYTQMVSRWARFSPWSVVIAGPIIEEIAYRLVLLSVLAWVVARFTSDRRTIAHAALGVSSLVFGLAHIFYGGVDDPVYVVGMAAKSSAAGLLLGWVFWRWGLPYSIICHCAANGIHWLVMPLLFTV
jgi:membrane protease YdiL (CAAX protease family)